MPRKTTVRIVTLGCSKNDVDSEEIAGVLAEAGYRADASVEKPDITIINTCGFLQDAKRESVREIRRAVRQKRDGETGCVIVAGCLAQRYGRELAKLAPGADAYVGVGQMARFAEIVATTVDSRLATADGKESSIADRESPIVSVSPPHHRWANVSTRARTGAPWSAYLKVSEGCNHKCTFCTIPSFRGPHVSKPVERILAEARHLSRTGAREINLIAQDVTQYGHDLYGKFILPRLLRELNDVEGLDWIRLLYCYPSRLTGEVIETMAALPKVLPYIDIPLQHAHREILRAMKRPGDGDKYLRLIETLRVAMPDVAIRTTFIVGFPGEAEAHFDYMLDFIRQARLDRVGAFIYSREPGTPSHDMAGQVPAKVKAGRYERLMIEQQGISLEKNRSWVGRTLEVLVEGPVSIDDSRLTIDDETEPGACGRQSSIVNRISLAGRSFRDAPEIDGLVFVEGEAAPGDIVEAAVEDAAEYDLYARLTGRVHRRRVRTKPLRLAGEQRKGDTAMQHGRLSL
ncbi:MAG: 30S ribosomal protein S12 methylthiotransferase RimO [Armatimonadetes bacterium]|nr:30S ribosomal protein S12 methylthiotransferase RimO [Armatimonadota bacterium]